MRINGAFIDRVRQAETVEDLYPLVQSAIELEHATIPPYLCGYFTLKLGSNKEVAEIIRSVVVEEMMHLTIASNLLLALGGSPVMNTEGFVPEYPGGLPFGIGQHLQVHLRKCTVQQVEDVFMAIEKPDQVINIPVITELGGPTPEFSTIGLFYTYLAEKITQINAATPITWHTSKQNVASQWFTDPDEMFLIDSVAKAKRAIDVIVDQGEGTHTSPYDEDGVPAHYYRFQEIVTGHRLIPKPGATPPFIFGGDPVVLDAADVWNMDDDPKIALYDTRSESYLRAVQFSYSYTQLLMALHDAFNGAPQRLDDAMGVMYELRLLAQDVLSTPAVYADGTANPSGKRTGLSFEYRPVNA